jgi:hypothetical protein
MQTMREHRGAIIIVGVLSALPWAYFWFGIAISVAWKIELPWNAGLILTGILLSIPASIVAAELWTRRMYAVTVAAASTLLFVMLRLH